MIIICKSNRKGGVSSQSLARPSLWLSSLASGWSGWHWLAEWQAEGIAKGPSPQPPHIISCTLPQTAWGTTHLNEVPAVVVPAQLPSYGPVDLPPVSCQATRDKHLGRVPHNWGEGGGSTITAGMHTCTTPEDQLVLTLGPLCDEVDALVARCAPHADRLALYRTELVRMPISKVVGLLYRRTDGRTSRR